MSKPTVREDLTGRSRREGGFVREVAVTHPHPIETFGVWNVDEADAAGDEHAVNRVQQVEEFLRGKVLDDIHEKHSIA